MPKIKKNVQKSSKNCKIRYNTEVWKIARGWGSAGSASQALPAYGRSWQPARCLPALGAVHKSQNRPLAAC